MNYPVTTIVGGACVLLVGAVLGGVVAVAHHDFVLKERVARENPGCVVLGKAAHLPKVVFLDCQGEIRMVPASK